MAHKYVPGERKYRLPDAYSRKLFMKIFQEKHGLHLYRYKGQRYRTLLCDAPFEKQQAAWAEFTTYEARLQRALHRAVDQLWERWEGAQ